MCCTCNCRFKKRTFHCHLNSFLSFVITFTNTDTGEKLTKTVKALHRFDSFETLYKTLPLLQCGYTEADVDNAHPSDMAQYYSPEEQAQFGVVGIELC